MSFPSLSNVDIEFAELRKLTWRLYTTTEALLTTNQVKLIDKREFPKAAIDKNFKTFVIHISALDINGLSIYPSRVAQIAILQ